MLIREETLREVGGLDPDLPTPWAEIDLCHRVWRHGERVAVQSDARVLFPDPEGPRRQRMQEQRTGQLLLLLKHRSTLMAMLRSEERRVGKEWRTRRSAVQDKKEQANNR